MAQINPNSHRLLSIKGLRKRDNRSSGFVNKKQPLEVSLDNMAPFTSLRSHLEGQGYSVPNSIRFSEKEFRWHDTKTVPNTFEVVTVVDDTQSSTKNQIRLNDTFISHSNKHHGEQLDYNMRHNSIQVKKDLEISFQRTIRMPDDNKLHQLPGSLGDIRIFNVEEYRDRLPQHIRDCGGLFLPMWQREAMWINFQSSSSVSGMHWAIRVFAGKINAISGFSMDSKKPGKRSGEPQQDYVVIPGQRWLDGICVAPGVVRQFVAMPLGSGYTVEGQKTSVEKHGGLQLEVIPQLERGLRSWARNLEEQVGRPFQEYLTPAQNMLQSGDVVRSYAMPMLKTCAINIQDLPLEDHCIAIYPEVLPRIRLKKNSVHYNMVQVGSLFSRAKLDTKEKLGLPQGQWAGSQKKATTSEHTNNVDNIIMGDEMNDLETMGLAAGGKLVQDIYADTQPANIWNHEAARIIYVHILDPLSCEKVTHIVPPPPPISAGTYAQTGGQFYVVKEKIDERLEGGDFSNIKSISQMDKHFGVGTEPEFDPTKPKKCMECEIRLCDCIIRFCDHQFCNVCIKKLEKDGVQDPILARKNWRCPTCNESVSHVAGFSAPMNLPGEEPIRIQVPVNVLEITDGRVRFESIQKTRI